ncbi:internal scaffolding protein [robinz microvirus RP_106]|nr:internal scaffolding protein [robinz microvirus RP_106]
MTKSVKPFPVAYHDFEGGNASDTVVYNLEPSLTRQEFAEECDINTLMKRYDAHVIGGPGNLPAAQPIYADFANMPQDLMGYLQFMDDAERSFLSLPAVVRKEFDNSAMEFIAFASDPGNLGQMRSWGLAPPAEVPDAPREDVTPPPGDAPPTAS